MNYPDDTRDFSDIMDTTWQSLSRSTLPDKNTKKYWFGKLQKYALGTVAEAFDRYIMNAPRNNSGLLELPSVTDIINICKPKPDQFALPKPSSLTKEQQQEYSAEVVQFVGKNTKPKTDYRAWARRIMANPSNYPTISQEKAREALGG